MSISQRLEMVFRYKSITPKEFSEVMNIQRSAISHILSGRNKPSIDFLERFIQNFPEFNVEWLISGKGEMIKNSSNNITKPLTNLLKGNNRNSEITPSLFDETNVKNSQNLESVTHVNTVANNDDEAARDYSCNSRKDFIANQRAFIKESNTQFNSEPESNSQLNQTNFDGNTRSGMSPKKLENIQPDSWSNIERMILVYNDGTFEIIVPRKK